MSCETGKSQMSQNFVKWRPISWNQTAVIRSALDNSMRRLKSSVIDRIQNRTKMTEMQVMITYADLHYNLKYCRSGWMWVYVNKYVNKLCPSSRNCSRRCQPDCTGSGQNIMASYCECNGKLLGSIEGDNFLTMSRNMLHHAVSSKHKLYSCLVSF